MECSVRLGLLCWALELGLPLHRSNLGDRAFTSSILHRAVLTQPSASQDGPLRISAAGVLLLRTWSQEGVGVGDVASHLEHGMAHLPEAC